MLAKEHDSVYRSATGQGFYKTGTLLAHLEFRSRLEDYVEGKTSFPIVRTPTACHANCAVGRWLHSEYGKACRDVKLISSLCESCEEFHEAASEAILLMRMGDTDMAKLAVQDGEEIARASDRFQMQLSKLHELCMAEAPHLAP